MELSLDVNKIKSKYKYIIPTTIAIWWLPIISGILLGSIVSVFEEKYKRGLATIIVSSGLASALYIFLAFISLRIPFLGHILLIVSVIFSIIDTVLAYFLFNELFYIIPKVSISSKSIKILFYASSMKEVEQRVSEMIEGCNIEHVKPQITLKKGKMIVKKECPGAVIKYVVSKAKKNKYKVRMHIKITEQ